MSSKWLVQVLGDPHKVDYPASWEISVVREDNKRGRQSWGWFDEKKFLISHSGGPCRWPLASGLGERMIEIAEEYASGLNDEDPTPWCAWCMAKEPSQCKCGPRAEND